jgi:hypothetical protein
VRSIAATLTSSPARPILRRIAYTLLTLFRGVTQRSEERRAVPWKALMTDCFFALVSTTAAELARPQPNTC